MAALDRLFATKPESERLHQAALMVLIAQTPLLKELADLGFRLPRVEWRTYWSTDCWAASRARAARFEAKVRPSPVRSLRLAQRGGSAWLCTEECGPRQLDGQRARAARSISLFERTTDGFDGEFYVGPIHASPPAAGTAIAPHEHGL